MHDFTVCLPSGAVVKWGPPFDNEGLTPDCAYFGEVFSNLLAGWTGPSVQWVLTWSVTEVPVEGDDVVVLCIGDEWSRWPLYAPRVRAVFKTHGSFPPLPLESLRPADFMSMMLVLQWLRCGALGLRSQAARFVDVLRGAHAVVHWLPVGTFLSLPTQPLEWSQRPVDVVFLGSVEHGNPGSLLRRLLPNPKQLSRRMLLKSLVRTCNEHPEWRVDVQTTAGFDASARADPTENTRRMAAAKVVVAPRGTSVETFRFFEGHRHGCVVVTEPLPTAWFYVPMTWVTVRRWNELGRVLEAVLPEGGAGPALSSAAREAWRRKLSPAAVAAEMARLLQERTVDESTYGYDEECP